MTKRLAVIIALAGLAAAGGEVSFAPGVEFSGAPSYVSEMATAFRDNGGPLSPFGSHFGLKAEVLALRFAGVKHYACTTGKNRLDYSRTGLMGTSWMEFMVDGRPVGDAKDRNIRFEYYGWEEEARFDRFNATARVFFLGRDNYVIEIGVENTGSEPIEIVPVFNLEQNGKKLSLVDRGDPGLWVLRFAVKPTTVPGKNFLAIRPVPAGETPPQFKRGLLQCPGGSVSLDPGWKKCRRLVFGYSPDSAELATAAARDFPQAQALSGEAWKNMIEQRDRFFSSLPPPHLDPGSADSQELYRMAATALDNSLYAPRGHMKHWACVPTKVHYNWFWLWDSGFQALGFSEFKPDMARDVIMTMFEAQRPDGFIAHMADERAKPLTPHSQSPVFGYSAQRIMARYSTDPANLEFKRMMYQKGGLFIDWWKNKRDVNHNGLFEFLSQDEGGWDNSPRMKYVPSIMFISYYGSLGELVGAKLKPLDSTDANAWMYLYYRAMERWAADLGQPAESARWKEEALALAERIDKVLWSEKRGCWLDAWSRPGKKGRKHFEVLTPHIWFPAFAGATRDEAKARRVIEEHLLNPQEFFGKYPIPTVAYNDPYFDVSTNSWKGSIWMVTAYSALEALFRFGYAEEADELRDRLLAMMADQGGMKAVYETYDPITGKYKNENSKGGYASAQFGWSSAFTMEMILERYEEERFVFADTNAIEGFIRRAEDFATRDDYYFIEAGLNVPHVTLRSAGQRPLLESSKVKAKLDDPYRALGRDEFEVRIRGKEFQLKTGREYTLDL